MATTKSFNHTQSTPSADWLIVHNLGGKVVSDVVLANGVKILPFDVIYVDDNTVRITFTEAITGSARLFGFN